MEMEKGEKMKQLIGKSCLLEIQYHDQRLYYRAIRILDVSDTHITFLDKFGKQYSFRLIDVVEINDVGEGQEISTGNGLEGGG